jgi:hypothetical protein
VSVSTQRQKFSTGMLRLKEIMYFVVVGRGFCRSCTNCTRISLVKTDKGQGSLNTYIYIMTQKDTTLARLSRVALTLFSDAKVRTGSTFFNQLTLFLSRHTTPTTRTIVTGCVGMKENLCGFSSRSQKQLVGPLSSDLTKNWWFFPKHSIYFFVRATTTSLA